MVWFKLCPRCSGDLFEDRDQYGNFITCIQCGLNRQIPNNAGGTFVISAEPGPAPVLETSDGSKRRRSIHGGVHYTKTFAIGAIELRETAP